MKHRNIAVFTGIVLSILLISCTGENTGFRHSKADRTTVTVVLQPLSTTGHMPYGELAKSITAYYGFKTVIGDERELPGAFINREKGVRYAASRIIEYLAATKPDSAALIIGLTGEDICISKKDKYGNIRRPESKYRVWGIFGLAKRPGTACIVSDKRFATSDGKKYKSRLTKITLHEVGHTLGLKHCTDKRCFMTDAVESIQTIDNAGDSLCTQCSSLIRQ